MGALSAGGLETSEANGAKEVLSIIDARRQLQSIWMVSPVFPRIQPASGNLVVATCTLILLEGDCFIEMAIFRSFRVRTIG